MKWILLIGLPLGASALLTHFISGWSDIRSSMFTLIICFAFLGGGEAIAFAIALRFRDSPR